jgi:hypothetical protein
VINEEKSRAEFIEKALSLHLVAVECPKCKRLYGVPKFLLGKARSRCCRARPKRIMPGRAQTGGLKGPVSISKKPDVDERSKTEAEAAKWAAWILARLDRAKQRESRGQEEKPRKVKDWVDNIAEDTMKQLNRNDLLSLLGKRKALPSRRPKSEIDYF